MSDREIYTKTRNGDTTVIALIGPLDLEAGSILRGVFWECIQQESTARLVIDLTRIARLDPSTISLLVSTRNVVGKKRGRLILTGIAEEHLGLLEQTHLTSYFEICPTLPEALSDQIPEPTNGGHSIGC